MNNTIMPVAAGILLTTLIFVFAINRRRSSRLRPLNIGSYMRSEGVVKFLDDCTSKGFSEEFSTQFLKSLLMAGGFNEGIDSPNLSQDIYKHWGLDGDLHEIVNRMNISGSKPLRWNDPKFESIKTMYDLMKLAQTLTQERTI